MCYVSNYQEEMSKNTNLHMNFYHDILNVHCKNLMFWGFF